MEAKKGQQNSNVVNPAPSATTTYPSVQTAVYNKEIATPALALPSSKLGIQADKSEVLKYIPKGVNEPEALTPLMQNTLQLISNQNITKNEDVPGDTGGAVTQLIRQIASKNDSEQVIAKESTQPAKPNTLQENNILQQALLKQMLIKAATIVNEKNHQVTTKQLEKVPETLTPVTPVAPTPSVNNDVTPTPSVNNDVMEKLELLQLLNKVQSNGPTNPIQNEITQKALENAKVLLAPQKDDTSKLTSAHGASVLEAERSASTFIAKPSQNKGNAITALSSKTTTGETPTNIIPEESGEQNQDNINISDDKSRVDSKPKDPIESSINGILVKDVLNTAADDVDDTSDLPIVNKTIEAKSDYKPDNNNGLFSVLNSAADFSLKNKLRQKEKQKELDNPYARIGYVSSPSKKDMTLLPNSLKETASLRAKSWPEYNDDSIERLHANDEEDIVSKKSKF